MLRHRFARKAITRLSVIYLLLLLTQGFGTLCFTLGMMSRPVVTIVGLLTALAGPCLSLPVSLRLFRHPHLPKAISLACVGVTYVYTCTSFAILYVILSHAGPHVFATVDGLPLTLGTALYFSLVTITTTGYGDISPLSGLARLCACWEIMTGLLYQIFVFSLAASLVTLPAVAQGHTTAAEPPPDRHD